MEPASQREQADTSLDSNTRFGLQKTTAVLGVFEIMERVMFFHLPARVMTQASGVEGGAPWSIMWSTCRRRAALGQNRGSTDDLCHIPPPTDAVLLGRERPRDKVGGLEVAFRGCDYKNIAAATEGSIFKAEQGSL